MERHFEIELNGLKERLLWMGSLAERAVHQAIHSVLDVDASLAEAVLEEIGLKPRAALELFYKQIIKRRAIPFPVQADSPEDDVLSPAARRNKLADEF